MKSAIGFYWTLPVPWAGFTKLPADPDEAAVVSQTIRYQRELVHRYARENRWQIDDEITFLELEFDRASNYVRDPLERVAPRCQELDAHLLVVDFTVLHGSRSHYPMLSMAEKLGLDVVMIAADPVLLDGERFDPYQHFRDWRDRQQEWAQSKPARRAALKAQIAELRDRGMTYVTIARRLNDLGVLSVTGKPHTADSVRKAAIAS
ncbi:hypothetical protein ACGYLO_21630 [Sulfitobacter sp. 1A13353]|uniref:hypothetical protein n=1 Tax=Sulfitobacter sp. 1A13353 TaxID=3368568 RepID=UPI0037456966